MGAIRFICMGKGILQDQWRFKDCGLPHFDPVPINVSVRPEGVTPIQQPSLKDRLSNLGRNSAPAQQQQEAGDGRAQGGGAPGGSDGDGEASRSCFCAIM